MKSINIKQVNQVVSGTQNNLDRALKENQQFKNAILDFLEGQEKNENYGISFHACGYNGNAQNEFQEKIKDEYNLIVF